MNPTKGKGKRYIYCPRDSECISLVLQKHYNAFNCEKCEIYLKSDEYQDTAAKAKKKQKEKEKKEMAGQTTVIEPDKKNQLIDLNNALFRQLDRLTDEKLNEEGLKKEILRSKAVSNLAAQIVQNAKLVLEGAKAIKAGEVDKGTLMLGRGNE